MRCVANANRLDESIAQLVNDEKSLQRFAFLRGLAPTMRATEFAQRAERAFSMAQGNARAAVKSRRAGIVRAARLVRRKSVLLESFCDGHPEKGDLVRNGTYRNEVRRHAESQSSNPREADPVEKSMEAATTEWGASDEKRGRP
jgi:hypothetical protein